MTKLRLFCAAKINLSLNILGRENGLHKLDSIMQSISLGDYITVMPRPDSRVSITFTGPFAGGAGNNPLSVANTSGTGNNSLPAANTDDTGAQPKIGADNTVKRAVDLLRQKFGNFGADLVIEKHIPLAAGLAGGSADCAGTLAALDAVYGFSARGYDLYSAAKSLGSDVSFMLAGGCVRVTGTGDILSQINNALRLHVVVARAPLSFCDTGAAYKKFDALCPSFALSPCDNNNIMQLLKKGDASAVTLFGNALTAASQELCGTVAGVRERLLQCGATNAVMTGSGSCVAGYFADAQSAKNAAGVLRQSGLYAEACHSVDKSIAVLQPGG